MKLPVSCLMLVLSGVAAAACGGVTQEDVPAPASTSASPGTPPTPHPTTGSNSGDDGSSVTTGRDAGRSGEAGSSSGSTSACAASKPSVQTVSMVVKNDSAVAQYLVTSGTLCDEFSLTPVGNKSPLPLGLGFQCGCECPNPGAPRPATLRKLAPGETETLKWDARSITTCSVAHDCSKDGWPGMGMIQELAASYAPVVSTTLEAKVSAVATVPAGCTSSDGTHFDCTNSVFAGTPFGSPTFQQLCPGTNTATAVFTLGAAKNVTVPISLQ